MGKELEALEPSVLLEFIDGLLKRYENKTDYNIYITKDWLLEIKKAIKRLEAIDNAEPSEALKCLEKVYSRLPQWDLSRNIDQCNTIKQALLKAQEPKHYLKWEDLEFKEEEQTMKVLLNGNKYTLDYYSDGYDDYIDFLTDNEQDRIAIYEGGYPHDKQFFNDLHLERVEE